jgi:putative spermidine/putrescine transport system permease protein
MTAMASASPRSVSVAVENPGLAAQVSASERKHLIKMLALLAPSVIFTALFFVLPLALFMFRSVDNPEIQTYLPRTAEVMQSWSGQGEPDEAAFAAIAADLNAIRGQPSLGLIGRRLNYALPGARGLLTKTARRLPIAEGASAKDALIAIDKQWADPALWGVLHQQSGRLTDFYLLTALDLHKSPEGELRRVAPEQRIFIDLYGRTLSVSLTVTALCLLIGFPVAAVMARAGKRAASWMLMLVLVPFWTSLLVRSTAWVILLQNEGLVNKALMALGIISSPLPLVFNRAGVIIAMVHVLLPYAILPIYSVMKGISGNHLRAAASLGASPLRVFRTVYLPLTLPGVAAGGTLVFVLSVGFYVTPALVGGPGDQMIGYFIAYFTNSAVNWGLASALGAFLLIVVAAIYLALGKLVGFNRLRVR